MTFQYHGHFLQRSISGPFPDAVNGDLSLTGTIHNTCNRIGSSHTKVIMTMSGENSLSGRQAIDMLHQILDFGSKFLWKTITCSIGNIHNCCTRLDYGFHYSGQIFIIRTTSIFCIELHILYILFGISHRCHSPFYNLFTIGIELISDMRIRGPDTGMDPFMLGIL